MPLVSFVSREDLSRSRDTQHGVLRAMNTSEPPFAFQMSYGQQLDSAKLFW